MSLTQKVLIDFNDEFFTARILTRKEFFSLAMMQLLLKLGKLKKMAARII